MRIITLGGGPCGLGAEVRLSKGFRLKTSSAPPYARIIRYLSFSSLARRSQGEDIFHGRQFFLRRMPRDIIIPEERTKYEKRLEIHLRTHITLKFAFCHVMNCKDWLWQESQPGERTFSISSFPSENHLKTGTFGCAAIERNKI